MVAHAFAAWKWRVGVFGLRERYPGRVFVATNCGSAGSLRTGWVAGIVGSGRWCSGPFLKASKVRRLVALGVARCLGAGGEWCVFYVEEGNFGAGDNAEVAGEACVNFKDVERPVG